ncbi:MAG: hypothetical protein DMD81_22160 [Candidatus Rokuibacteriota bacterium]|nr:MAG: hypothetical protein DMD81_22160 [Candidatus Rokubacteria bacterium]
MDGEASFWRPGAADWAPAQRNTPLGAGDELFTGHPGNIELQVGPRAFVRAWGDTQLGLANLESDFLQLKITTGHVAVDLRTVEPGRTVEIDTPTGAFMVAHPGYYRVDVAPDRTSFITRRGGQATLTSASGQALAIASSEDVLLDASGAAQTYVAPEPDSWDSWNYARTDSLVEAVSARYVAPNVYGASDLDQYGAWRVVPTYGTVWVPEAAPAGWVPYSSGRWVWDPAYGWTWVDAAPWGWAPFHYGRWVYVDGFWAWAPGPRVVRAAYAPALVAFFGAPGVRISVGAPAISWVALGWGEPLVPWWGRYAGRPWWGGWGGPRTTTVVNQTTIVNKVTVYQNVTVRNAVVTVGADHFSVRPVHETRLAPADTQKHEPIHGRLPVRPAPASFVAGSGPATRPPEAVLARPVVATRPPAPRPAEAGGAPVRGGAASTPVTPPPPRLVNIPRRPPSAAVAPARPPFGKSDAERPRPPAPAPAPGVPHPAVSRPQPAPPAPAPPSARPEPRPARPRPDDPGQQGQSPVGQDRRPGPPPGPGAAPAPPQGGPAARDARREAEHERPTPPRPAPPTAIAPPGARPGAPGTPAGRPEHARPDGAPPGRPLPGEPANRLSP